MRNSYSTAQYDIGLTANSYQQVNSCFDRIKGLFYLKSQSI